MFAVAGVAERVVDWQLAFTRIRPCSLTAASVIGFHSSPGPDYSQAPPDLSRWPGFSLGRRCCQPPTGNRVKTGKPELPGKDATYRAESGRLGSIMIKQRPMSPEVRCMLISHEFIHVLQHLQGDLRGVSVLGWTTQHPDPIPQESEAYGHQQRAGYVLWLLKQTERTD